MKAIPLLAIFLASVFVAPAWAEAEPTLLLADGGQIAGDVQQLRDGALRIGGDNPRSFAPGEWARWSHPVAPSGRPRVCLTDATWLVARLDWSGKVPVRLEGDEVVVQSTQLGEVRVSRNGVQCLLFEAAREPEMAERLVAAARQSATEDRVWLMEGDMLTGEVVAFDGTRLEFRLGDVTTPILASRVAAVAFAAGEEPPPTANPAYLVGLADGSLLAATELSINHERIELTTPHGGPWRAENRRSLRCVQSLAPEIIYLSDLEPVDYRHTPYLESTWPLGRDRSLSGSVIEVAGQRYAKGLAMHSAARAVYRVPPEVSRFAAEVALDAAAGRHGSVVFRVYLAGQGGVASAYESPVVRGGDAPLPVLVDLNGAQGVVLVVDYADQGDELDHAVWLDARLVK